LRALVDDPILAYRARMSIHSKKKRARPNRALILFTNGPF
jgi:hypothetical protein